MLCTSPDLALYGCWHGDIIVCAVAAFNAWFDYVVEQTERSNKLRKYVARLRLSETYSSFMMWKNQILQAKSLRRMVKKMLSHTLSAALNKWSVSVKSSKKARAEEEVQLLQNALAAHQEHIVGRLRATVAGRGVNACFITWRDDAKKGARNKKLVNKLLNKWLMGALASSFTVWKADVAIEKRARQLLQRATARMSMKAVGAAWQCWAEQHRILKISRRVMRKFYQRQLSRAFITWLDRVRSNQRARTETRLKLATAEANAKQMAMHTETEKHAEVQDRIASMLCRLRASKELRLRFKLAFKLWQVCWLAGRNAHLQQRAREVKMETQNEASHSTGRLLRQIANLEAELSGAKKSLADATNALHRKGAEEQSLRAQAKNAQSSAHQSAEAMEAARALEAERVRQLEDELAAQKRATQEAKNAAEAQKVALERAVVVHKEELRVTQEEVEECSLCHSHHFSPKAITCLDALR